MELKDLNKSEKEQLLKALQEKAEREKEPLRNVEFSVIQKAAALCRTKIQIVLGGNRTGKTEFGGILTCIHATGIIPKDIEKFFLPEHLLNGAIWCSAINSRGARTILKEKLDKYIPTRLIERFHIQNNCYYFKQGVKERIGLIMSEAGREAYQGTSRVVVWLDEEHPEDIYTECFERTADCNGRVLMTYSPVEGITWAYDKLIKHARKTWYTTNAHGIKEGEGIVHTLEELQKMQDRVLRCRINRSDESKDNVEVFIISKYDNMKKNPWDKKPTIEAVQEAEKMYRLDPASYRSRILGLYTRVTGKSVFPEEKVMEIQKLCKSPSTSGDLINGKFVTNTKGSLLLFKDLKKIGGSRYVIGADTGEGIQDGDFSCAQILDHYTGEQVAVWHGKVSPEKWGEVLRDLGVFFNMALIAPERNGIGRATVAKLIELKYRNVYGYYPREFSLEQGNKVSSRKIWGWDMNGKTKPLAEQGLCSSLNSDLIKLNDFNTCEELFSYVYFPDGKTGALQGCHDDRVTSLMIAEEVRKRRRPNDGGSGKIYYHGGN